MRLRHGGFRLATMALVVALTAASAAGAAGASSPGAADAAVRAAGPLDSPVRVLDTRSGGGPLVGGTPRLFTVRGVGTVPADATAVVLDVTFLRPTRTVRARFTPSGRAPDPTGLQWVTVQVPTSVAVYTEVGPDGRVAVDLPDAPPTDQVEVVVDVVGWYGADDLVALPYGPIRVMDTRVTVPDATLGPGGSVVVGDGVLRVIVVAGAGGHVLAEPVGRPDQQWVAAVIDGDGSSQHEFLLADGGSVRLTLEGGGDLIIDLLAGLVPGAPPAPLTRPSPPQLRLVGPNQLLVDWSDIAPRDGTAIDLTTTAGAVETFVIEGGTTSAVLDDVPAGVVSAMVSSVLGDLLSPASEPGHVAGTFVPMTPRRVVDTREIASTHAGKVQGGEQRPVPVGNFGVPSDATAVVLNVTATDTTAPGYVSVYPGDGERPLVSNLNIPGAGTTVANLVVVPMGPSGGVWAYAQTTTHLVVDVAGYWLPAGGAASGRFRPLAPTRLLDSREGVGGLTGPLGANATFDLQVAGRSGIPIDAAAAAFTLTATETAGPGWFNARPAGTPFQTTSSLNATGAGQTVANLVVVPLGADGKVTLAAQTGGQVIADVTGWFTGAGPTGTDGRFVPVFPTRILDTRLTEVPLAGEPGIDLPVAGHGGVPVVGAAAVVANLTATESQGAGYLTAWPSGTARPEASNLNVTGPDQTVPNLSMTALGAGRLSLYASDAARVHAIVDVAGFFTT